MAAQYSDKKVANMQIMQLVEKLRNIKGFTFKGETPDGNGGVNFQLSCDINFFSWGEKIDIHMSPYGEQQTNIEIKSECALPTQIIDMGKNKDNVNNIFRYLLES